MPIFDEVQELLGVEISFDKLTIGEVVDTNDPQQMGRIRAACPFLGDDEDTIIENIPWATPISPLAGSADMMKRGREEDITIGPVAYGMFNVPKVGSYVLIACLEGDPRFRIYLGGVHDQFLTHTLPHGRYSYNKNDKITDEPSGPLSSTENEIQPLYKSQTKAFTKTQNQKITESGAPPEPRKNYEYRTRFVDHGVAGLVNEFLNEEDVIYTKHPDDVDYKFSENDGNEISHTHGYHKSRIQEGLKSSSTEFVFDPQVYSWTTPGFHSISMSDNSDGCKIKIRTTHGHQIIMDDTNERIYINTAEGKTWIEIDEKGNIDIYGERNISMHAEKDINFTAGDTFRVKAKNGVHLVSEGEMRLHSKSGDLHIKTDSTLRLHAVNEMRLESESNLDIKVGGKARMSSVMDLNLKSDANTNFESSGTTNIRAGGQILQTGTEIHMNGPGAAAAESSLSSEFKEAWWTNRVPEHEPWPRVMTKKDATDNDVNNTHKDSAEYPYDDKNVGRMERGEDLGRNPKWHR